MLLNPEQRIKIKWIPSSASLFIVFAPISELTKAQTASHPFAKRAVEGDKSVSKNSISIPLYSGKIDSKDSLSYFFVS